MTAKSAHPERQTQNRIIKFFENELKYTYLGNLEDEENFNVRWGDLKQYLSSTGLSSDFIESIVHKFHSAVTDFSQSPYHTNKEVYSKLKYGIKIAEHAGEAEKTIYLINWEQPEKNDFYIAEEVTVNGNVEKRPDLVLYINGIAVAVIELKKSTVSVADGIRQNVTNQREDFIQRFFSTIQICAAANDSEGLRYGTSGTTEKYYLEWREDCFTEQLQDKDDLDKFIESKCEKQLNLLEKQCYRIFQKDRLLDVIHNFIIYDSGIKKVCRCNQFYALKRCEKRLLRNQGGIVWHTQGSGKSLTMVWLSKWILENIKGSRVLIITDREELDDQIEKIFTGVDLHIARSKSSDDLLGMLDNYDERLMCSLIHKFGRRTGEVSDLDYEKYVEELKKTMPEGFSVKDKVFVFETKPRLCDGRGNALLVAGSIAEACRYCEIFQEKNFKNCAIVSSYKPNRSELRTDFSSTTEDSENWKKQKAYLKMLGYNPDVAVEDDDFYKKIEAFEKNVKQMFANLRDGIYRHALGRPMQRFAFQFTVAFSFCRFGS